MNYSGAGAPGQWQVPTGNSGFADSDLLVVRGGSIHCGWAPNRSLRWTRRARRPHENELSFPGGDGSCEQLLEAHEGLTKQPSALLNAPLIIVLANQVGDAKLLKECTVARQMPA
jgi:hypothetical protein